MVHSDNGAHSVLDIQADLAMMAVLHQGEWVVSVVTVRILPMPFPSTQPHVTSLQRHLPVLPWAVDEVAKRSSSMQLAL
jgi:hypothetical protein